MTEGSRLVARVRGVVQGVGFRDWVRREARRLELAGFADNRPDGTVEVIAEGSRERLDELLASLRGGRAPGRVIDVVESWEPPTGMTGFRIG